MREFGQNITKVYEDRMSHAWAVMWVPVLNEKLLLSLNSLILEFKEKRGYTPTKKALDKIVAKCYFVNSIKTSSSDLPAQRFSVVSSATNLPTFIIATRSHKNSASSM